MRPNLVWAKSQQEIIVKERERNDKFKHDPMNTFINEIIPKKYGTIHTKMENHW